MLSKIVALDAQRLSVLQSPGTLMFCQLKRVLRVLQSEGRKRHNHVYKMWVAWESPQGSVAAFT